MTAAMIARIGAAVLSDERRRKAIGWIIVAVLSPLILATAVLCSIGAGGEDHNKAAISACFYGVSYTEQVPQEFREHVDDMRTAFSRLDSVIQTVNQSAEDGGLDATRVKAVFLCPLLWRGCTLPPRGGAVRRVLLHDGNSHKNCDGHRPSNQ